MRERRIKPKVTGRIGLGELVEAHRRLEAGGFEDKLVFCPAA